jgi:hypothetical protein
MSGIMVYSHAISNFLKHVSLDTQKELLLFLEIFPHHRKRSFEIFSTACKLAAKHWFTNRDCTEAISDMVASANREIPKNKEASTRLKGKLMMIYFGL